ncbi:MAG: exodeoxyribonuclease VII large subunit [Verrucomicrobiales bacterium]|nr:exodeoxyribonuclease VII large subunit [Verrucomicrobiales bacterium]
MHQHSSSEATYSVTQITREIRDLLEGRLTGVWIEGEISNYRHHSSGHRYFNLKDNTAQISCVFFRGHAHNHRTPMDNGDQVQIYGDITVYEARGQYQLMVKLVQAKGAGELQARFEALKQKLSDEGLFDQALKKDIPNFPQTIAIVTSPTGAAVQDMLNILQRRAPWVRVLIYPVAVQGKDAEHGIAQAINELSDPQNIGLPPIDTIVVTRGGGSMEDLWNFNEECVARAIAACPIPIVSAVGHEIDFTIADFVADLRAPTPSAAAELIVPDANDLKRRAHSYFRALENTLTTQLDQSRMMLRLTQRTLEAREPMRVLMAHAQHLDHLGERLTTATEHRLADRQNRLNQVQQKLRVQQLGQKIALGKEHLTSLHGRLNTGVSHHLEATRAHLLQLQSSIRQLSPQTTFARGFSMTTTPTGEIVTSPEQIKAGDPIETRVADGKITSTVDA